MHVPCYLLRVIFACCGWCCQCSLLLENAIYFACFEMPNYQPRMTQRGHFFLSTKILFARPSRFYGEGQEQQSAADFPLHNARLMANCQVFVLAAVNKGHATWMLKIKSCCYENEDKYPSKKEQWKHNEYPHAQDSRIVLSVQTLGFLTLLTSLMTHGTPFEFKVAFQSQRHANLSKPPQTAMCILRLGHYKSQCVVRKQIKEQSNGNILDANCIHCPLLSVHWTT